MNITLRGACAARDEIEDAIDANAKAIDETKKAPRIVDEAIARARAASQRQFAYANTQAMAPFFWPRGNEEGLLPQDRYGVLLAFFSREELLERQAKRIREMAPKNGISSAERKTRLSELQAERDKLWYAYESENMKLEDAGHVIVRRGDIDPQIVRQVWIDASEDKPRDMLPMMQRAADSVHTRVRGAHLRDGDGVSVHAEVKTE